MSPFDWASLVTGMNFALGSHEKFQPSFRDGKRPKILGTKSWPNTKNLTFGPIIASVTLKTISLQLNGMLTM